MAGLGANFEYDLKEIITLSTLSQLGVMIRILSLGYATYVSTYGARKKNLFFCLKF